MERSQKEIVLKRKDIHKKKGQFANFVLQAVKTIDQIPGKRAASNIPRTFRKGIGTAILNQDYTSAIYKLMELIDLKQGIHWHVLPKNPITQHEVLIRDARHCRQPGPKPEAFIIMGLNYIRAMRILLPIDQFNLIKDYICNLAINFFHITKLQDDIDVLISFFTNFNSVLVSHLADRLNVDFSEAHQRLMIAKDFTNLEDPARDIITLAHLVNYQDSPVLVFQGDCVMTLLTPALKSEYMHRTEKNWYNVLPEWKRALVDHVRPFILSERSTLPTQTRAILPGVRNAYETISGIVDLSQSTCTITTHAFHSGTIVYLGKDNKENKRINLLHGEQLRLFTGAQRIHALTLNSRGNPSGNDRTILNGTDNIMDAIAGLHTNLPFNMIRRISPHDYSGIKTVLTLVAELLSTHLKQWAGSHEEMALLTFIENYLPEESTQNYQGKFSRNLEQYKKFEERLKRETPDANKDEIFCLCGMIELAMHIRHLINNDSDLVDEENRNLELGCYCNLLTALLERYDSIAINSSCESGKDRDGILMFRTALAGYSKVLFNDFSLSSPIPRINTALKQNIIALANVRHQQTLAGCQGGTLGAYGIKKDSKHALPNKEFPDEAKTLLIEPTASFNKNIPVSDQPIHRVYFRIGDTDFNTQKRALLHSIHLHHINVSVDESRSHPSTFFQSTQTVTQVHNKLIALMNELKDASTFSMMSNVLSKNLILFSKSSHTYTLLKQLLIDIDFLIGEIEKDIDQHLPSISD